MRVSVQVFQVIVHFKTDSVINDVNIEAVRKIRIMEGAIWISRPRHLQIRIQNQKSLNVFVEKLKNPKIVDLSF